MISPVAVSAEHLVFFPLFVSSRLPALVAVNGFENGPENSGSAHADDAPAAPVVRAATAMSPAMRARPMSLPLASGSPQRLRIEVTLTPKREFGRKSAADAWGTDFGGTLGWGAKEVRATLGPVGGYPVNAEIPRSAGDLALQRRGGDSNSRYANKTHNGFRDRRIQPLCHPSWGASEG